MKRLLQCILIIVLLFTLNVVTTFAALISVTTDVVYDDVDKRWWVNDLRLFEEMTYQGQKDYIDGTINTLTKYNFVNTNWHMATLSEMEGLWNNTDVQIGAIFQNTDSYVMPIPGTPTLYEWSGRYDQTTTAHPGGAAHEGYYIWVNNVELVWSHMKTIPLDTHSDGTLGAWVTTSNVPIPPAFLLLGSGLIGIVGIRKKFKK
jgi:hypothetical protein